MGRIVQICAVLGVVSMSASFAQTPDESPLPGNSSDTPTVQEGQSEGTIIQQAIADRMTKGLSPQSAATTVLSSLATDSNQTLVVDSKRVLSENMWAAGVFFRTLVSGSDIFEATITTIEALPAQVNGIVTLAVTFFPESAADIIAAAGLSGEISEEEAIQLALAAGANVNDVTSATAAGGAVAATPTPLGAGVGAGGTGGGDTTASSN